jgi:hypothetical protein
MPHAFPERAQSAFVVGQDGILRAGCQPAPLACLRAFTGGLTTRRWSFYIFSSGGGAHELGIGDFDFEFLQKLGVLAHLLA